MHDSHPDAPDPKSSEEAPEKQFHLWRLLGAIGVVMLLLAAAAALVDILVLGW